MHNSFDEFECFLFDLGGDRDSESVEVIVFNRWGYEGFRGVR